MQSTNLFNEKSSNALIVAMDHGLLGVQEGFERPEQTLKQVLEGFPDGIMVTPNFARRFHGDVSSSSFDLNVILRLDFIAGFIHVSCCPIMSVAGKGGYDAS